MISFLFALENAASELLANQAVKAALNVLPAIAEASAPPSIRITIAAVKIVIDLSRR